MIVKTSYSEDDVVILLKDLTDKMQPLSTSEREKLIQSGVHYSEMLPEEKAPSDEYMKLYERALNDKKKDIAECIARVSELIVNKADGSEPILVSLARAGIPVGILIKRFIKFKYKIDCEHYAISIIRDKGIDLNAMNFIYSEEIEKNRKPVSNIFFIDGWTGKGAIKNQLIESVETLRSIDRKWADLSDDLYVLADSANVTPFFGTREDYLLPTACLNSTVSGLTSRTILNKFIDTEKGDFHGAVYFSQFESIDKSNEFIDTITKEFAELGETIQCSEVQSTSNDGMQIVNKICQEFDIADYKKVKPGIGETTRVLLRRMPWKVLIDNSVSMDDNDIEHIVMLCNDKHIPIERYDLGNYKVCGIIKELSADA